MSDSQSIPCIYVLAGSNGAGKSSVAGATFRQRGADYFNPDEAARLIRSANPGLNQAEASGIAWHEGKRLLERAIAERCNFAFETTLGGNTMTRLLAEAVSQGMAVRIWYLGLSSPDLHVARVRARVEQGGHDVPETMIRDRYDRSRLNLIRLLPNLTELRVYDNTEEADPRTGVPPRPLLVLHVAGGTIVAPEDLSRTPPWAKAIVAAALKLIP